MLCDHAPIGKNSTSEAIRLGIGLISLGDLECRIIFFDDAIYFLNQKMDPEAVNMNQHSDILRLIELTQMNIYVLDESMDQAGLERSDLISYDNLKIITNEEMAQFILEADSTFRF